MASAHNGGVRAEICGSHALDRRPARFPSESAAQSSSFLAYPELTADIIGPCCSSLEEPLPSVTPAKHQSRSVDRSLEQIPAHPPPRFRSAFHRHDDPAAAARPPAGCHGAAVAVATQPRRRVLTLSIPDRLRSWRCSLKKCPGGTPRTRCPGRDGLQPQGPHSPRALWAEADGRRRRHSPSD